MAFKKNICWKIDIVFIMQKMYIFKVIGVLNMLGNDKCQIIKYNLTIIINVKYVVWEKKNYFLSKKFLRLILIPT